MSAAAFSCDLQPASCSSRAAYGSGASDCASRAPASRESPSPVPSRNASSVFFSGLMSRLMPASRCCALVISNRHSLASTGWNWPSRPGSDARYHTYTRCARIRATRRGALHRPDAAGRSAESAPCAGDTHTSGTIRWRTRCGRPRSQTRRIIDWIRHSAVQLLARLAPGCAVDSSSTRLNARATTATLEDFSGALVRDRSGEMSSARRPVPPPGLCRAPYASASAIPRLCSQQLIRGCQGRP